MKRIVNILASLAIVLGTALTPAIALAQESEETPIVEVETTDTTTDTTTTDTAGVPETGIAPQPSMLGRNLVVFAVGGTAGALIGLGIISLKKQARK